MRRKYEVLQSAELPSLQVSPLPSKSTTDNVSARLVLFDALFNSVLRLRATIQSLDIVCCPMINI